MHDPKASERADSSQAVSRSRSASARAASAGASPRARCAPAMLREARPSPPARPGANAAARSSTRPPCAPTPGSRNVAAGISSRARARWPGAVAPTTAPTSLKPSWPTPGAPSSSTNSAIRSQTVPPSCRISSSMSAAPRLDVRTSTRMPLPARRAAVTNGSTASLPISGLTVTRSAPTPSILPKGLSAPSISAWAYARAVTSMSPRFPSAITSSPRSRAYETIASSAAHPAAPSTSKRASCGLTATHACAVASISARQCSTTAPAAARAGVRSCASCALTCGHSSSGSGSRPSTICDSRSATRAARVSPKDGAGLSGPSPRSSGRCPR